MDTASPKPGLGSGFPLHTLWESAVEQSSPLSQPAHKGEKPTNSSGRFPNFQIATDSRFLTLFVFQIEARLKFPHGPCC